jgi:hypothetical protein
MYLQYPLEALARRRGEGNQLDFARAARLLLRNTDEAVFKPLDRGLAILAANEAALEEPRRILQEMYGDLVEVRDPRVRRIPGTPVREPIMQVRITARRENAPALLAELRKRGARLLDESAHSRVYVVRAEAPLAALLGLPARIDSLTGGLGMHSIRLVRYGPAHGPCIKKNALNSQ